MSRRRKSSWTLQKPWYKRLCRKCKGTGFDPGHRARICPNCRGFGW